MAEEIDPITGKPKKSTILPQTNTSDPNAKVPLSPDPVLSTAQNSVLSQQPQKTTQLQDATTKAATDWVNNPMGDYDPAKTKQATLEKADMDWSKSFAGLQQQFGNVSGSGLLQKEFLGNVLSHNTDMANQSAQIDTDNYNRYVDSLGRSQANALAVNKTNEDIFSQRLGNLSAVRGMAEGERSQTQAQANAIELQKLGFDQQTQTNATQFGYDLTKLKTANDFAAMSQDIDNKLKLAMQANDATTSEKLTILKGQIDAAAQVQAQKNAIELQKLGFDQQTQTNATQFGYDLTKLKTANDFAAMSQDIDNKLKLAMQANDAATSEKLTVLKGQIDAAAQVQAQKNAIELQNLGFNQQMQMAATEFGYDLTKLKTANDFAAMSQDIDNKLKLAMQANDAATSEKLTILKGQIDAAAQVQAQKNAIELQNLGYDQTVQTMAIQNGYDLVKLDKAFGNEMAKLVAATNLDTASKSTLMELQDKIDTKQLLTQNDFTSIQKDLDRQAAVALQSNDIAATENITKLKAQLDAKAQEAQNVFADTQRAATELWKTGERIGEEEFAKAAQYYDWAQKNAAQNNDIDATKAIEQMRSFTQMSMQQQDMNQQEKMLNLSAMFEEAKANGDVARQAQILDYTYAQDIAKMTTEAGFDMAKIGIQGQIEQSLKQGDYAQAESMQRQLLAAQAEQNALDRAQKDVQLQLESKGLDVNAQQAEWARLQELVAAGQASPDTLTDFINQTSAGITITPVDPIAAYKESQAAYTGLLQQFGLSNPNYVKDAATGELTDVGKAAFNKFYNENMYNTTSSTSSATSGAAQSANVIKAVQESAKNTINLPTYTMPKFIMGL